MLWCEFRLLKKKRGWSRVGGCVWMCVCVGDAASRLGWACGRFGYGCAHDACAGVEVKTEWRSREVVVVAGRQARVRLQDGCSVGACVLTVAEWRTATFSSGFLLCEGGLKCEDDVLLRVLGPGTGEWQPMAQP